MPSYIAFLRAVNVGKRQLKMADARKVLEDNGFGEVDSYIQTGNLRVTTPMRTVTKVEAEIGRVLSAHAGFDIVAIVRTAAELPALVRTVDGIPESVAHESSRYVSFCLSAPTAERAQQLHDWDTTDEHARVIGKDVLMELGVPFNEMKLTGARIERILGVPGTARNLTVVRALAQKWGA